MNDKSATLREILIYTKSINLTKLTIPQSEKDALPYLIIAVIIIIAGLAYFVIRRAS